VTVHALVGGKFLRNFLVTIEYGKQVVRLARYSDESHIDTDEYIGPGFDLVTVNDVDWTIKHVNTTVDAYAKGVRDNEVVDAIGGTPITGQPASFVRPLFKSYAPGTNMPISIRNVPETDLTVKVYDLLPHYPPPP